MDQQPQHPDTQHEETEQETEARVARLAAEAAVRAQAAYDATHTRGRSKDDGSTSPEKFLASFIDGHTLATREVNSNWLVDGLIRFGTVTCIAGNPGAKKTWLTYELARAVLMGEPFLGQYDTQQSSVVSLWLDASQDDVTKCWLRVINPHLPDEKDPEAEEVLKPFTNRHRATTTLKFDLSDITQVNRLISLMNSFAHDSVGLDESLAVEDFLNADGSGDFAEATRKFKEVVERSKCGTGLLIVDSLAVVSGDADENKAEEMKRVMMNLNRIAAETGAAVVILHHLTKPAEANQSSYTIHSLRGSTTIGANVDAAWVVVKQNSDISKVFCVKSRGAEFDPIKFMLQPIMNENEEVFTMRVVYTEAADDRTLKFLAWAAKQPTGSINRGTVADFVMLGDPKAKQKTDAILKRADRVIKPAVSAGTLVKNENGGYDLTELGKEYAETSEFKNVMPKQVEKQ